MQTDQLIAQLQRHYLSSKPPSLGAGTRPALLVVDFIEGFTNPDSPLAGCWDDALEHTAALLREAQQKLIPAIFTTVEYEPADLQHNLLIAKAPRVAALMKGSQWTAVDHRLPRDAGSLVIAKKHGSAFFGTALVSQLQMLRIDTLLVAGCVTSGCVRASVVDAAQYGFRALVCRDAVADRSALAHEANLLDMQARYADVISSEQALAWLKKL
ncbi:MAG: isochorismatase family protein [Pseudomonadota bacterium]|nr:isochorismatase family protein [Pseudomonadota bacterium]